MSAELIQMSIARATEYLTAHPEEARSTDKAATATLEEGLRFRVDGPAGWRVTSDMAQEVGGGASAPSPGWLMRSALASCTATLIAMRSAQKGVLLTHLEIIVDSESDDRGFLDIDDSIPPGPLKMRIRVQIAASNASAEELHKIICWAEMHSPVADAICRPIPRTLEIEFL